MFLGGDILINIRKEKIILCLCLILFLCFFYYLYIFKSNSYNNNYNFGRIYNDKLVLNVSVFGKRCAYDRVSNRYYISYNKTKFSKLKIKLYSLYNVKFFYDEVDSNHFLIHAYNNDYYQDIDLYFTNLPIIDIHDLNIDHTDDNSFPFGDLTNSLEYDNTVDDEPDFGSKKYFASFIDNTSIRNLKVDLKLRGASSIGYPKKSYKISFEKKISFFNLPSDDKYVLDALFIDKSSVRNILSTDMWNLINDNQLVNNDLHGSFIEVFIDNEYQGIYVMKDKVDRSVTRISNSGVILKSVDHMSQLYIDKLINNDYDFDGYNFLSFEVKNYNDESFKSLVKGMKEYYSNPSFKSISENYDIDNFINYFIFVILIDGHDNVNYNYYLSLYDEKSKIMLTPWDMDLTWGLNYWNLFWNGEYFDSFCNLKSSYDSSLVDEIVATMDDETLSLMKKRYFELRNDVITMDVINNYLNNYESVLLGSEANERDSQKWYKYNLSSEIDNIRKWASMRIEFLDKYFADI